MADHLSLGELGIEAGSITRIGALDTTPPPGQPLQIIAQHLGPAVQGPAPTPQRGWENIFRPGAASPGGMA